MAEIQVIIAGDSAILMHNPAGMRGGGQASAGKKEIPTPEAEAAASRYLSSDKTMLVLKADHLHACLLTASRGYRLQGRESVYPYIAGSIEITPELIPLLREADATEPLGADDYEVDLRRVVVQGQGVLRGRAKIWPWAARFTIGYDEGVFTRAFMEKTFLGDIARRAGKAVGLLEYRPSKGGRFGRWHVERVEW